MFGLNGYLIGGVAAGFILLAATAGWYAWDAASERADRIAAEAVAAQAQAALAIAVSVNEANQKTIGELRQRAALADKAVADLVEQLSSLQEIAEAKENELEELRKGDTEVDEYLNRPVPPGLGELLDR